jgi:hypothetical protein
MLTSQYFREHLPKQVKRMGHTSAEVHLQGGIVYRIAKVELVAQDYVLLTVFPPEGTTPEAKEARIAPGEDKVTFDRVSIPYESISHLFLSVVDPEHPKRIGLGRKRSVL